MLRMELIVASIVLAGAGAAGHTQQAGRAATVSMIGYDDFLKLSADQRRGRWGEVSAENKSAIVRTHAQRWLRNNRGRLTGSEVSVFQEMIAFVTPERYRTPGDVAISKEEEALRAKMRCGVHPDDVMQAFGVLRTSPDSRLGTRRWTYLRQAKCWLEWIMEDIIDYIPTIRR